ncbi:hypothetical protein G9A89_023915 [Geosiphon pyriformis]|nr:hypothetical protein G9A89_023915 [Geosiphon pyriformis]
MMDFGLSKGYKVYDSLDQKEVKKHKSFFKYWINSKFIARTGRIESNADLTFYLAAGAFNILNIASEFIELINISINMEKTVVISINPRISNTSLEVSGSPISIAKTGKAYQYLGIFLSTKDLSGLNLKKANSDVKFFSSMILHKVITDKQFSYLVLTVLQPIRNTSGNCKDSLREDPRQWVDFSSASEKEYINTHNNQELKNNLHRNSKKKAFSITEKTKVATKTPNLTVLEFCRAIYTQNQSDLGLPEGCCPAESALTYYINAKINYHIGKEEEPHNAKLGLYRELSQYTTKEVAQYANENFPISTGNIKERANKTKENLETNQESNQQKLGTPAQTPKKTGTQSIKKQRIYSPEDKSYHFSPENKIQIPLGAASSSTSTPQTPRTSSYIDKIKQRNWGDIPITGGYSSLFQNPLFQPKFRTEFENREEESESESEKETSEKTITRPVTGTSSQSRNQETRDQEKEPDIREATFRNTQGNIIPPSLRPINPPAENGNEMTTSYITRLTDFSGEEEETDVHTWLREAQKAIQANNWNDQRAIQTLSFFLKGTADSWYQSLETKPTSFAEFKNALLEYFSDPNAVIQLQNKFNTIKQNTGKTVTQYLARFNRIRHQIEVIEQGYYTDPQVLNQFIRGLKSSILGRVRPAHPNSLPEAVTLARALELAEKEVNHSQMVNMVMEENKTETLEKRVTRLGEELSKKIESYLILDPRKNTYQPPQRRSQEVSDSRNNHPSCQEFKTETRTCHFCKREAHKNNYYVPPQMPRNQYMPIPCQYSTTYQNQGAYQQQPMIANPNWRLEA